MFLRCGNLNKIVALATLAFYKYLIISIYWSESVATELQDVCKETGLKVILIRLSPFSKKSGPMCLDRS